MFGDKWLKTRWYEFSPISYIGLVLVFGSIAFRNFFEIRLPYASAICFLLGLYLIHKGRKKRGKWD